MLTRKMALPDKGGHILQIQFLAKRDSEGFWEVFDITRSSDRGQSVDMAMMRADATQKALMKHLGKDSQGDKMNFDEAFLVLRELEEGYLKYSGAVPDKEPFDHYMAAYRLLPQQFREGLDDVYQMRRDKSDILPRRDPPAKSQNLQKLK
ncbi:MAG: hypothetical protein HY052_04860 [Proteobacteria bacterium]|nr:hypothetical protein [Pseudomonadota bacterium]